MKLKDTIKLLKYVPTPELNIVTAIIFGICILVTALPLPNFMIGAFWANYIPMYFIGQITMVAYAGVIQSSEKYRKIVTKNIAILLAIVNLFEFGLFVVIRTYIAYIIHTEKYVNGYLISFMIFQILYVIYGATIYKKVKLGLMMLVLAFLLVIFSVNDNGPMAFFNKIGAMADIKVFVIIAGVVCMLTPLLYYGLSLLLYKLPYYDIKINRTIDRSSI